MYLYNLKIWNFRKISTSNENEEISEDNSGLNLIFNQSLNVIVGENNSGKTSIIDSIAWITSALYRTLHKHNVYF